MEAAINESSVRTTAQGLNASLNRSVLQKAIRRGDTAHAIKASCWLSINAPHLLGRSLLRSALEDIGASELELVQIVIDLVEAGIRNAAQEDVLAAVERLAATPKCQAAADLMMVARQSRSVRKVRSASASWRAQTRIDLATSTLFSLEERGVIACFLSRERRDGDYARATRKASRDFFELLTCNAHNAEMLALAQRAYQLDRADAVIGLALLSSMNEMPAETGDDGPADDAPEIAPGVPAYALDQHTLPGAWALTLTMKEDAEIKGWLKGSVRWWENRLSALAHLLFLVEGKSVQATRTSAYGVELNRLLRASNSQIDTAQFATGIELIRSKLPTINEYRLRAFEMCVAGQE